jgi:hypothetical protein
MRDQSAPRARRVPVAAEEPLIGGDRYDYADAFEVRVRKSDSRSGEQFARYALEGAPWPVRWTVLIAQRQLLRLRLGPRPSPDHIFGWKILTSHLALIHVEAVSPLLGRGVLVLRRTDATRVVCTTYVFYTRPALSRVAWEIAGPLHRWVAGYLLERAAEHRAESPATTQTPLRPR